MANVDLKPNRAAMATTSESSQCTSACELIRGEQSAAECVQGSAGAWLSAMELVRENHLTAS
jgi:hypothetical protein